MNLYPGLFAKLEHFFPCISGIVVAMSARADRAGSGGGPRLLGGGGGRGSLGPGPMACCSVKNSLSPENTKGDKHDQRGRSSLPLTRRTERDVWEVPDRVPEWGRGGGGGGRGAWGWRGEHACLCPPPDHSEGRVCHCFVCSARTELGISCGRKKANSALTNIGPQTPPPAH